MISYYFIFSFHCYTLAISDWWFISSLIIFILFLITIFMPLSLYFIDCRHFSAGFRFIIFSAIRWWLFIYAYIFSRCIIFSHYAIDFLRLYLRHFIDSADYFSLFLLRFIIAYFLPLFDYSFWYDFALLLIYYWYAFRHLAYFDAFIFDGWYFIMIIVSLPFLFIGFISFHISDIFFYDAFIMPYFHLPWCLLRDYFITLFSLLFILFSILIIFYRFFLSWFSPLFD